MSVEKHTGLNTLELLDVHATDTAGGVFKAGTSSSPLTSAVTAMKFSSQYYKSTATSDDARGQYLKLTLAGAGGGGEALRAYTDVYNVAAATAHGAHLSLGLGTSGSVTGLGVAARCTLHVPGALSGGTYAAVQAEIYADAATANTAGATVASFIRVVLGGDGTGAALIEDSINLLSITGGSNASGNLVGAAGNEPTWTSATYKIRIKANGTTMYLIATAA